MNEITAEKFKEATGREPEDDDLERCNCGKAGQMGHFMCGWNSKLNLPVFMAGGNKMSKLNDLATNLQSPLFATRETIEDAYKYAADIINTLPAHEQVAVYTAVQVLVNTIAEEVKRLAEEVQHEDE